MSFIADQADLASAAQTERQRHLGPNIAHDVGRSRMLYPGYDRRNTPSDNFARPHASLERKSFGGETRYGKLRRAP
jgi:hypothetical protein